MTSDTIKRLTARLDQFVQWKNEYENMRKAGDDVEDQLYNLEKDMEYVIDMITSEYEQCLPSSRRKDVAMKLYKNDRMKADRLKIEVGRLRTEIEQLNLEIEEMRRSHSNYKTVAELLKEGDTPNGIRRCPKCGKYMEMSNVKEYVPDNCSYGRDMKRVVVGRLYKCNNCGTEEYEKIDRWL